MAGLSARNFEEYYATAMTKGKENSSECLVAVLQPCHSEPQSMKRSPPCPFTHAKNGYFAA